MKVKFICHAVKWHDKVNGNTYHSARITRTIDGKTIYAPFQYGYANQYIYTALEAMEKAKWIPAEYKGSRLYTYERENDYPIMWIVTNGTKRECIENGKE